MCHVYVYVCICMCLSVCICGKRDRLCKGLVILMVDHVVLYTYVCICMGTSVCMCVMCHVCVYVCICICSSVCTCVSHRKHDRVCEGQVIVMVDHVAGVYVCTFLYTYVIRQRHL